MAFDLQLPSACLRLQNLTMTGENWTNTKTALLAVCERFLRSTGFDPRSYQSYTRNLVTYYLTGVAGVTVCCFGIIGNFLSLIVLTRRTMHTSTYCYLAALAVCDLLFDVCTLAMVVKDVQVPAVDDNGWAGNTDYYAYLFPYVHPAAFAFQVCSVWLTLAFTVDRYIMICHPFKSEPLCTVARARRVVAGLVIGCAIFNLPKFFEYTTVFVVHPTTQDIDEVVNVHYDFTSFGKNQLFKELFHHWFYMVFVFAVPFVTIAILNSFLVHAVRMSRQRGRELNSAEVKRMDTTVMLIGVVVIFFVCQLPAMVSRMTWAREENSSKAFVQLPLFTLNEIANFLVVLNSSINIVPYYFFGQRFRKEFLRLFCCCFCNRDSGHVFSWSASRRESQENY